MSKFYSKSSKQSKAVKQPKFEHFWFNSSLLVIKLCDKFSKQSWLLTAKEAIELQKFLKDIELEIKEVIAGKNPKI